MPHKNVDEAMSVIANNFFDIPFCPQLVSVNKSEDMIVQYLENVPGILIDRENDVVSIDNESDEFFEKLEEFFLDYEEITVNSDSELLDKYAISPENSSAFMPFIDLISINKPNYAKCQIVGPFTLSTTLTGKDGRCVFYDETLREILIKALSLKALWQIKQIKKVSPNTMPIVFIDEPSLSQLGTSAYITISEEDVLSLIKEVSDVIKDNGGMSAIHCCGKCDWALPIKSGVDIINFDGYFFAQNLSLFYNHVQKLLDKGGFIAWGIIPTLDKEGLEAADLNVIVEKFEEAIDFLVKKGIDKDLLISRSMVTPSCGAGSLSVELAEKAMELTSGLSEELKKRYGI